MKDNTAETCFKADWHGLAKALLIRLLALIKGVRVTDLVKAPRVRLHLNIHNPIELVEMALAFQGLADSYGDFLKNTGAEGRLKTDGVRLYVTKIESNCILADMAPAMHMLGTLTPFLGEVHVMVDFVSKLKDHMKWLIDVANKKTIEPQDVQLSKASIINIKRITQIVAKNKDADLRLQAIHYNQTQDDVALSVIFSQAECRDIYMGAQIACEALETKESADYEKVLMYFYQTNVDDPKSAGKTGDKAIVRSIITKPLPVYVIQETARQRIKYLLHDKKHNPLQTGFLVDINVERDLKGAPKIYRVIHIHNVFYDNESEAQ